MEDGIGPAKCAPDADIEAAIYRSRCGNGSAPAGGDLAELVDVHLRDELIQRLYVHRGNRLTDHARVVGFGLHSALPRFGIT